MRKLIVIVALATLIPASLSAQQRTPGTRRARPGATATAPKNRTRPADAEARKGRDSVSDPMLERILQLDGLNLTEDQITKMRSVSEKARTERQKEMAKQRKEMQKGETPTDEQREKMKAELRKTQEKTRKDLMDVLTKEQRQIVEEKLKTARRRVDR